MIRYDRICQLGSIGEGLVAEYFRSKNYTVTLSEDKFDSVKDMTIDGKTVEVKTLVPIYKFNAFCLPVSQWRKCEEVDRLIFVKVPDKNNYDIVIYESIKDEDTNRRYDFRQFFNNESCQFYRLTNLEKVGILHDLKTAGLMWSLSPSTYKR